MRNKGVQKIQITNEVVDKGADPVLVFKKQDGNKNTKQNKQIDPQGLVATM